MKIALITDTHWGVRNDNVAFMDNSKKFLDDIFFPYLDQHNITTICHLGDLVDRRKYINYNTALRLRQDFLGPIFERGIALHIIAGNHDTYFKNTNRVNALDELVRHRYNVNVYDQIPREVEFDGCTVLMLPWICDENREICLQKVRTTPASIVMGHLELAGFEMYRGSMVSHGDDRSLFDRFNMVLSGHYHHRSSDGTIYYLGSHAEFTWSDYDDPKGFHVLDTDTRKLEFIKNPFSMFEKVWYNDTTPGKEPQGIDLSGLKGKIVKVIVTSKSNPYLFDKFIEQIEKVGALEMQIVDDHMNLGLVDDDDIVNEAESTIDIFKTYISGMEVQNVDKRRLENTITELYNEALTIE
jgi:DNA repair exonuclease SbcCD nuclease subunit